MLWTPGCDFQRQVDNIGSTFTEAGIGTGLTAGGTNHTKNASITSILSALPQDCYGLVIGFSGGFSAAAARRFMTDIYVDPAGGTSWNASPLIANLVSNNSSYTMGGTWYYFPIFIKAGSSIGATCQAETASATQRIMMIAYMQPSHPELVKVGSYVRTTNISTASTVGTTVTPGVSGAMGSYADASAGNDITDNRWWWQLGVVINDTTQTAGNYWFDLAVGDATNKIMVIQGAMHLNVSTAEVASFPRCGGIGCPPFRRIKGGTGIRPYVRCATNAATADSNISAVVYSVGG